MKKYRIVEIDGRMCRNPVIARTYYNKKVYEIHVYEGYRKHWFTSKKVWDWYYHDMALSFATAQSKVHELMSPPRPISDPRTVWESK